MLNEEKTPWYAPIVVCLQVRPPDMRQIKTIKWIKTNQKRCQPRPNFKINQNVKR